MPVTIKKIPPSFKHGGYCATDVLPGESAAAFEKLKKDIVDELAPNGPLEDDIVKTLARLVWRKQNSGPSTSLSAHGTERRNYCISNCRDIPLLYNTKAPSSLIRRHVTGQSRTLKRRQEKSLERTTHSWRSTNPRRRKASWQTWPSATDWTP